MKLKDFLNQLVIKYETPEFIKNDPIQFPHRFQDKKNKEISGIIASSLAYGKREKIIQSVDKILTVMQNEPFNFIENFDFAKDMKLFDGFCHRFTCEIDIVLILEALRKVYKHYDSLEELFLEDYSKEDKNVKLALIGFVDKLRGFAPKGYNSKGFYYLLPSPVKNSACKRLNLFLKWMTRTGPVDLNLWKNITSSQLIIPLDVHISKQSRNLGLTSRKANDWTTAEEITEKLKQFDARDPVKYDFAIFGMGVYKELPVFSDIET